MFNITLSKLKISGVHAPLGPTVDMPLVLLMTYINEVMKVFGELPVKVLYG